MKERFGIFNKPYFYIAALFISIVIVAIVFFSKKYLETKEQLRAFVRKDINGKIAELKNENRGSYYIEIRGFKVNHKLHSFPIASEVREYNIQIGDSVSKGANCNVIMFYRLENGIYKKYCQHEIWI